MNSIPENAATWRELYTLCQPLCREAYQPGNRDTFVSGSDSGFLLENGHCLIVAIAGSDDVTDWLNHKAGNLHFAAQILENGCAAHAGMLAAARAIAEVILDDLQRFLANPDTRCLFTGHSRGGAIAQILPFVLGIHKRCQVVTFGSPKVLVGHLSLDAVHFQNWSDIVPRLPITTGSRDSFQVTGCIIRSTISGKICEPRGSLSSWDRFLSPILLLLFAVGLAIIRNPWLPASIAQLTVRRIAQAHRLEDGYAVKRWCGNEA